MKSSAPVLDPHLAWALWHGLTKLSLLLWDGYKEDFLKLAEEERAGLAKDSDEDLEIPF